MKRPHGASCTAPLQPHVWVRVSLSLSISYLVLGVLVSPSLQEDLYSCGVTFGRGYYECSLAILHNVSKQIEAELEIHGTRNGDEEERREGGKRHQDGWENVSLCESEALTTPGRAQRLAGVQ